MPKIQGLPENITPTLDDFVVMLDLTTLTAQRVSYSNIISSMRSGISLTGLTGDPYLTGPWVDVRAFMDGIAGRPTHATWNAYQATTEVGAVITAAIAATPTNGTLVFPPGTYAYVTSPNFAVTGLKIISLGAILKHTGAGNAFSLDGGAVGGGVLGMSISDLIIQGCATSDNGIFARAIHHSIFNNLRISGTSASGNGLLENWCVANQWNNFRCTTNEDHEATMPQHGIYIDRRGVGENSTTQTFINPIMEGLTGNGIHIDYASHNIFVGGTSESNGKGIYITVNGFGGNSFHGIDLEANVTYDLHILGQYNNFVGIYSTEDSLIAGGYNRFWGGTIDTITINGDHNSLSNLAIVTSYINNSSFTRINSVDGPGGYPILNTIVGADSTTKKLTNANAAPTTGTWVVGDICYNQTPSSGNPAGWMCTVAGTPGTWVAMGNLA